MKFARVALPVPLHPLDSLFDYRIPVELEEKVSVGSLVELDFARRKTWGVVWEISNETSVPEKKIKDLSSLKFDEVVFSKIRKTFLGDLSHHYFYPLGEVCEAAIPSCVRKASQSLLNKPPTKTPSKKAEPFLELNEEQKLALEGIWKSEKTQHLLWGITGSGKTEVYLHLIDRVLREKKNALVLVPEISLTPLLFSRFEKRFPGELAVFHSAQKPAAQRASWLSIFRKEKRIALGARSALFAPLDNIGIIIVDEEHDSSYKQEERLRYNARNDAIRLAKLHGAKVILGSATPSVESLYAAKQGYSAVHKLEKRAAAFATLPQIRIVDLKNSLGQKNMNPEATPQQEEGFLKPDTRETFFITPQLEEAMERCFSQKKQAILFLNRRGLGRHEFCSKCGHIPECPSCEVTLTPHHDKLLCHYCGFESRTPENCSSCSAKDSYKQVGVGTQSVVLGIETLFPKARILRMDRDTITKAGELENTIALFEAGEADVLVGTQMVAKGHDFPNVTLVGILLAELGLSVPDFRAEEKTLQLLLQVSGRAGRAKDSGEVIIQSFSPELRILEFLKTHTGLNDLEEFLDTEILKRAALHYPPEAELVMLRFDGITEALVQQASEAVAVALRKSAQESFQILGPVPSPLLRIRNRYRYQILIKTKDPERLRKALNWIHSTWHNQKLERKYKTRLLVDVDPVQML